MCSTLTIYGSMIRGELKLFLKDAELFSPKLSLLANSNFPEQTYGRVLGILSCELTFIMFRFKHNLNSDVPGLVMLTLGFITTSF